MLGELQRRVPVSFELGIWGLGVAMIFSVPMGVWAALRQDRWPDYGLRSLAILLNSVPSFWIAVLVITFGSIWFNWAPPINFQYIQDDPWAHLQIMALPAAIIGLTPSGGMVRLVRTQMLEVLREDYIRTAHAKGLSMNTVLYKHALRNALIPVVTVIGSVFLPNIVTGTVIFEQIFIIPGMGRYLVDAVNNLDYPGDPGLEPGVCVDPDDVADRGGRELRVPRSAHPVQIGRAGNRYGSQRNRQRLRNRKLGGG